MKDEKEEATLATVVYEKLKQVIDPEIGLNIVDLGLVYNVSFPAEKTIEVTMTLTTPGCPMGQTITTAVKNLLQKDFPGTNVQVELVWLPMWEAGMITESGQAQLNGGFKSKPNNHEHESLWDRFF